MNEANEVYRNDQGAEDGDAQDNRAEAPVEQEQPPNEEPAQPQGAVRNPLEALVDWWKKALLPSSQSQSQSAPHSYVEDSLAVVTLHFDEIANCSVAVLSKPCQKGVCSVYFQCRVEQGKARQHSVLYYELDGFVREQFLQVQRAVQPHTVHLAVGALQMSDKAQVQHLEEQRQRQYLKRHGGYSTTDEHVLTQVLEICRLHRLQDDLDVLDLYFLAQTNHTCRQVATRIWKYQRTRLQISVTPYVDGANMLGYSHLTRQNETNLIQFKESGRTVLYQQCRQVVLRRRQQQQHHVHFTEDAMTCDQYVPVDSAQTFSWACEEIALASLHHWWGDIAERDYIGQKLVVTWQPPTHYDNDSPPAIILDTVRLEAGPKIGKSVWQTRKTVISLHVMQSETRPLDDITLSYAGQARVMAVHVPWMTLVKAAAAKLAWPRLTHEYAQVQQVRPLLPHELEYGDLVHALVDAK